MGNRPKIFIGICCFRGADAEYLEDMMRFAYHLGRRMPDYDFFLGIMAKKEQFRARNAIVEAARQMNCDWLLMLDDDMIINTYVTAGMSEAYGFVEKLIAHGKDICGVLYYQRSGECQPVVMKRVSENGFRFLREDEIEKKLQRVDVAGGGCLLINMRVFDKLKYPYFEPEFKYGTDIQLCSSAMEQGFEVWADTSIEVGHLRTEKVIITSRNRHQYQMADSVPGEVKQFISENVYDELVRDACEYTGHKTVEAMMREATAFLERRKDSGLEDPDWYREHGRERVSRQVAFNTQNSNKRLMTEYIIGSIDHRRQLNILDFGCGIGLPAFSLARQGHNVTALDIRGTGTLDFLKWRARKHGVRINFMESEGGVPELNGERFDAIVAMDSIEHIAEWREVVQALGEHLKPAGVLFSNNAVLADNLHPEHYSIDNKEFVQICMQADLMPFNQITYLKK